MRPPKFNFVPENQLKSKGEGDSTAIKVSLQANGQIVFNPEVVRLYEFDNKFAKFYADTEKKVIGWSIIEGKMDGDDRELRQFKPDAKGIAKISVSRLLRVMDYTVEKAIKRLEVRTYKSSLYAGEIYYFELPSKEVVVELNGEKQSTKA